MIWRCRMTRQCHSPWLQSYTPRFLFKTPVLAGRPRLKPPSWLLITLKLRLRSWDLPTVQPLPFAPSLLSMCPPTWNHTCHGSIKWCPFYPAVHMPAALPTALFPALPRSARHPLLGVQALFVCHCWKGKPANRHILTARKLVTPCASLNYYCSLYMFCRVCVYTFIYVRFSSPLTMFYWYSYSKCLSQCITCNRRLINVSYQTSGCLDLFYKCFCKSKSGFQFKYFLTLNTKFT